MVIYGLSQSTGVERCLEVGRSEEGISLSIFDHPGGVERDRIVVPVAGLLGAIIDRSGGVSTIEGASPAGGVGTRLDLEVRRNEVQLRTHSNPGDHWPMTPSSSA